MEIIFNSIFFDIAYFDFFKVFNDLKVVCKQWCLAVYNHEMTKKYESIEFYPGKVSFNCQEHKPENCQCGNPESSGLYRSVALNTHDQFYECTLLKEEFFSLIKENYIVKSLKISNLFTSEFDLVLNSKPCLRHLHIIGDINLDQFKSLPYWPCFDHLESFTIWKISSKEEKNINNFKNGIIKKYMKSLVFFKETNRFDQ